MAQGRGQSLPPPSQVSACNCSAVQCVMRVWQASSPERFRYSLSLTSQDASSSLHVEGCASKQSRCVRMPWRSRSKMSDVLMHINGYLFLQKLPELASQHFMTDSSLGIVTNLKLCIERRACRTATTHREQGFRTKISPAVLGGATRRPKSQAGFAMGARSIPCPTQLLSLGAV